MNKTEIERKFIEIIGMHLDIYAQREEGFWPPHIDFERWENRYRGTPADRLPKNTVAINCFKNEVNSLVSKLMQVVEQLIDKKTGE